MSYAQRFMQNKAPSTDSEGWQTVGGGGYENRAGGATRRWTEGKSQFPSAFSKPRREEERGAPMRYAPAAPPPPKPISLDSTEDFPTLGGKPKAAKAPVQTGWASKAASWAAADAAEAAEQKRQEEAVAAEENERMKAAAVPDLFSRIRQIGERNHLAYRGDFQEPDYDGAGGYVPRSPPYDPDYEGEDMSAAPANPHLDYVEERDWTETGR